MSVCCSQLILCPKPTDGYMLIPTIKLVNSSWNLAETAFGFWFLFCFDVYICVSVWSVCMCTMCEPYVPRGQKRASEVELWLAVNNCVGVGNQSSEEQPLLKLYLKPHLTSGK